MSDLLLRLAALPAGERAALLRQFKPAGTPPAPPATVPLTPAQAGLWFGQQLEPDSPVYNLAASFALDGPLDVDCLRRAIAEVVRRHESLRTRFPTVDGQPVQSIEAPVSIELSVNDLSDLQVEKREERIAALQRLEARRPFRLEEAPLIRFTLLRLALDQHRLLVTAHHLIADGWSLTVFTSELAALYPALLVGQPAALSEPLLVSRGSAARQLDRTEPRTEDVAYWLEQLSGELPLLQLTTARPRPVPRTVHGGVYPFEFSAELTTAIRAECARTGQTPFVRLFGSFVVALNRLTGQDDFVIGVPSAGRDADTEQLIGFFVNTLPIRVNLTELTTHADLARRVQRLTKDALVHQHVPFDLLVRKLQPPRDPSRAVLRQVAFAYQEIPKPLSAGPLTIRTLNPAEIDLGVSRLDLSLYLWLDGDRFTGYFEYNSDLFDPEQVDDWTEHLLSAARESAQAPTRPFRLSQSAAVAGSGMTESQLLFYFGKQYQPEVRLYYEHVTTLFTVPPDLDRLHLQRAIQKLVDLSDALRSTFYEVAGVPERHLRDTIKVELPLVDLSAEPEPDAALATWAAERCDSEMDLTKQPFDTALVKLAPDRLMWFLKVHHLVSDAWSTALILRRTSELYHLSLQEQLDSAPALPAFQDYVDYENSLRRSARYRRAERFWHELLGKQAEQFDFYRRDGMPATTQTARLTVQLGADRTARVGQLAKAAGLTSPAVVLAAALFGYLRRISGQDLIRIGTPLANRPLQFRETIGLFMNASPLQVELAGEPTFVQLLRQVQLAFHQAARHQHHPVKNPAHEPVYDIYFNYQNVQLEGFDGTVGMTLLTTGQSNDRLALQVRNFTGTDEYELDFDFNVAFFEAHDQARTVDHYLNVLDAMLDDPQAHLAETVLLTPAEQHQLVQEFNRTARPYPLDIPLHEWIERQVARTPGLPAVRFEQQSLSYAELNARANQLARRLVAHGVTRDCLVGVHLERSLDLVVALLAVLKAGAAYLPLDPHYPAERLGFIIRDSGSSVVITTRELATEAIRQPGVRVMLAEAAESAEEAEGNLGLAVTSDQLAYVIYTSGSTGRPKAVQIEHRSICNRLLWMQETYRIGAADRVLQKTPFTFDVSVWEFFWPLMTGACLVVARPGGHQDPAYLIDTIRRQDITTVHFVPSMLRVFLDTPNASTCDCLERVFCSGEALPPDLVVRFHELIAASLFNLYGPTEAAVDVSAWACEPMSGLTTVPIGRPVANTQLYVLDRDGQLAPCGIAGELYIGGVQLARGYLGRPDLTEQRFPPTTRALNSRLYRTGDLVRQRVDGAIEFLGRLDSQVKLRGYRIELGEIEACLLGQPMVRDACVQLWNDHLVAYLVPAGPSFNESRVRAALAETLPHYMLPSFFVQLRALPTTSNGKLDRKALPAPEQAAAVSDAELPRTETEAILAQLWAELLGRDGIDIHSDFFTLGGHSLLAAKLVSMIQHRFGLQLPLATLLRASTVAALAAMVDGDAGVSSVDRRLVPIHDRGQLPPLFAFHPAGGEVIGYRGLAAKMGENRPLLGIQSRCLAGQTEHPSIAAMVTEYVAVIRHRQPYGPYHLLGWSMGGVVAVAAAAELENQGEQVAFLGLLDSHLGDGETDPLLAPAIALAGAGADMAVDHAVITELRSIIRDVEPEQRVQAAWRWARRRGLLPSDAALLPALERQAELATVHEQLLRTYQPPVLDCPITVWWASDRIHAGRIPDWGLHTHGNVIEESTPGNHFTMLQPPHVNQLAARLRTALDQLPLHGLTSKEKVKHHDDDSALPGKPLSPRSVQRTQAPLSVRAAELG